MLGGGDEKGEFVMNVMQILHGTFNTQNWQEEEELREIWRYVQDDDVINRKLKKLEEPVFSRW